MKPKTQTRDSKLIIQYSVTVPVTLMAHAHNYVRSELAPEEYESNLTVESNSALRCGSV